MKNIALSISEVTKYFDERLVLDAVDLQVKHHQIFGFIGLNGVGKTTLIKIILDLLDADDGMVKIFGVDKILPVARKKIFYLPEKFQPSIYLTGMEFLRFVLDFHGLKVDEKRLCELCGSLELPLEVLQKKVIKYSKGMTQKLGLIATFLSDAELVILDEPMSGLDLKARINLKRELLAYKKRGKTVFFSSHLLTDMDEICDEIAVLNGGKIAFCGAPEGFKEKYGEKTLDGAFLREIGG